MDLAVYFIIAILMVAVTWFIGRFWRKDFKKAITTIAGLAVVLPLIVIFIIGAFGILQSEPEVAQEIADSTIANIINYVIDKLPYIVISDVAGIIVGSLFTKRED